MVDPGLAPRETTPDPDHPQAPPARAARRRVAVALAAAAALTIAATPPAVAGPAKPAPPHYWKTPA